MPANLTTVFDQLIAHVDAGPKEWKLAIEGYRSTIGPEQDTGLSDLFLDYLSSELTPTYQTKNDKVMTDLFTWLGLSGLYSDQPIDGVIGEQRPKDGWKVAALEQSRRNLGMMQRKRYSFSNTFTREMISIGWRDVYLSALTKAGRADTQTFTDRILTAGGVDASRLTLLEDSHEEGWLTEELEFRFWWRLISQGKKAAKLGPVNGSLLFIQELEARA